MQALRRNTRALDKILLYRFGTRIAQRQIDLVAASNVGVTFDQEHIVFSPQRLERICRLLQHTQTRLADVGLAGGKFHRHPQTVPKTLFPILEKGIFGKEAFTLALKAQRVANAVFPPRDPVIRKTAILFGALQQAVGLLKIARMNTVVDVIAQNIAIGGAVYRRQVFFKHRHRAII